MCPALAARASRPFRRVRGDAARTLAILREEDRKRTIAGCIERPPKQDSNQTGTRRHMWTDDCLGKQPPAPSAEYPLRKRNNLHHGNTMATLSKHPSPRMLVLVAWLRQE